MYNTSGHSSGFGNKLSYQPGVCYDMELNVMLNSLPGCYLRFWEEKCQSREDVCSHRICRDCETNKSPPPLPLQVFSFILFSFTLVFFQALVLKELKGLRKFSRNCVYKAAFYVSSSSNLIHFFYFFLIRNLLFYFSHQDLYVLFFHQSNYFFIPLPHS